MDDIFDPVFHNISRHISLTGEEKEYLKTLLVYKKLRKRQYLLQEGDVMRTENFVLSGCLRTYEVDSKGQESVIHFSIEDWWVGDMYSFLSETPSVLNIDCLENSELLQISKANLEKLYVEIPKFERFFRILIQNAYISSVRRVSAAMNKSAMERYLDFIQKYPEIFRRVPNHQIASFLGLKPESLSRIRKQLVNKAPGTISGLAR